LPARAASPIIGTVKFFAGLVTGLVAAGVAFGAYVVLALRAPCAGACQGELECIEGLCVARAAPRPPALAPAPAKRSKVDGGGGGGLVPLVPADDTPLTVGDLGPDEKAVLELDGTAPAPAPAALPDAEIAARVEAVSTQIVNCIAAAETRVDGLAPGTVKVSFRVPPPATSAA
jgi:hypothetical protein